MNSNNEFPSQASVLLRKTMRALLVGVGGNIILFLFLTTFLHISETNRFIPWIIAFNSCLTGFSLVSKDLYTLPHLKAISVVTGLLNALISTALIVGLTQLQFGDYFLGISDYIIFAVIGMVCSGLGTLLAVKYYMANPNQ